MEKIGNIKTRLYEATKTIVKKVEGIKEDDKEYDSYYISRGGLYFVLFVVTVVVIIILMGLDFSGKVDRKRIESGSSKIVNDAMNEVDVPRVEVGKSVSEKAEAVLAKFRDEMKMEEQPDDSREISSSSAFAMY